MFTPKAYPEILERLVAHIRDQPGSLLTDFNVGSVTRSWLEAGAIGLDEAWMGLTQAVVEAIPEAVYQTFRVCARSRRLRAGHGAVFAGRRNRSGHRDSGGLSADGSRARDRVCHHTGKNADGRRGSGSM
ncbi:MAG: hypothetical protein MZV65_31580 [Chromatiales bacterium]|nr:hypothetical protein [Chromatiales bacterium]